jgi:hypothetical protein
MAMKMAGTTNIHLYNIQCVARNMYTEK